jgi:hypothetical protein
MQRGSAAPPKVLTVQNQQCSIFEKSFSVSSAKLIFVSRVLQVRSMVADLGAVDPQEKEYSHALTSVACRTRPFSASHRL